VARDSDGRTAQIMAEVGVPWGTFAKSGKYRTYLFKSAKEWRRVKRAR